ncbi:MAG: ABC transporter permease [Candidatus Kaistia colombiensis]|nr:MAG: ABC transporter permease [Kaistia sp.]
MNATASSNEAVSTRIFRALMAVFCIAVLLFLITPVIAVIPLSFNAEPYLTYPLAGVSLRWYATVFTSDNWLHALKSSLIVATATTLIATPLGTFAAFGLMQLGSRTRRIVTGLLLLPLAVPAVVVALALYISFSRVGLANSYAGLIIAHTALATPFVVVTVSATLASFDYTLLRAAASLGSGPIRTFRRVVLPLIRPGVISGGLFAFITSWDDVIIALFIAGPQQRTLPRQMFSGLREQLDPSIMVVATLMIAVSVVLALLVFVAKRKSPA